jgi:hypothetical protein
LANQWVARPAQLLLPFRALIQKEKSKTMGRIYSSLLLATVLTIAGYGCSKTYHGPNGEKVTVGSDGNVEMTATGKDGEKIRVSGGKGMSLPNDFPKDVPIYTGATILSSVNSKDGMMLTLQTADPLEKVDEFYVKQLKDQGWTTESSVKLPQGANYGNKKEKRTLNVSINHGDQTMVVLIVAEEK